MISERQRATCAWVCAREPLYLSLFYASVRLRPPTPVPSLPPSFSFFLFCGMLYACVRLEPLQIEVAWCDSSDWRSPRGRIRLRGRVHSPRERGEERRSWLTRFFRGHRGRKMCAAALGLDKPGSSCSKAAADTGLRLSNVCVQRLACVGWFSCFAFFAVRQRAAWPVIVLLFYTNPSEILCRRFS